MKIELIERFLTAIVMLLALALKFLFDIFLYPKVEQYYYKNPSTNLSKILRKLFNFSINKNKPFKEKVSNSLEILKNATDEIDNVIEEISYMSQEKQLIIEKLEEQLKSLELEERSLKEKIITLENVPIETLQYFEEVLNRGEKRSANRDYFIFVLGIIITTIVGFLITILTQD